MKNHSTKNTYSTSSGLRLTRAQIEKRIRLAKKAKLDMQILEWGYNYCEDCLINANAGQPLDLSHKESVKVCLESGQAQKAYSVDNLRVLCRKCHREHDKTALNSSSNASDRQNGHH